VSTSKEWNEGRWEGLREALEIVGDERSMSKSVEVRVALCRVLDRIRPMIPAKEDDRG
jgi:hypothetical protein